MSTTSKAALGGIHHVTAIAGPAAQNLAFYVRTLRLRLVKKTVNFDDPGTYHLYYGDEQGRPGTIMTFFPWAHAVKGRAGTGMVAATSFEVPAGSLTEWGDHLAAAGVSIAERGARFGEEVLSFYDPDGLPIELIGTTRAREDGIGSSTAIRGFRAVTLDVSPAKPTARLLVDVFGYEIEAESGDRLRFRVPESDRGDVIDVLRDGPVSRGRSGAGTIHHVAFRVSSEEEQLQWKDRLESAGHRVTSIRDRQYFKSIYFREPGGVLFEIATDPPGFTLDESVDELGTSLKLPEWLESRRDEIESQLGELNVPA